MAVSDNCAPMNIQNLTKSPEQLHHQSPVANQYSEPFKISSVVAPKKVIW